MEKLKNKIGSIFEPTKLFWTCIIGCGVLTLLFYLVVYSGVKSPQGITIYATFLAPFL